WPSSVARATVVRGLGHHVDVMRMAFGKTRASDLDEAGILQLSDVRRAAVTHRRPQPASELARHRGYRAPVRHPSLDALGHELVPAQHVVLEIPVLGV